MPRIKSPEVLVAESGADLEGHGLRRTMGLFQLVCFGVWRRSLGRLLPVPGLRARRSQLAAVPGLLGPRDAGVRGVRTP
ncbi:hypothetical protein [Streptomyces silvisoli]|uniref:DUF4158 domain-containing protein n=1 Tax=Streptomyces silvisoli TaxID=3034235 RepID=A0ABT5ZJN0_9ACTN|nr:hypothetical protein [Streptomyces silvisoli]MDF3290037.1 hypothetical protein [Streptomyces silvisoli]